jgi:metal-responsive CopG/Arc/MetJ family transcriptional regulator
VVSLPEEALERLDKMAAARGVPRSQVVEALIMSAPIREGKTS